MPHKSTFHEQICLFYRNCYFLFNGLPLPNVNSDVNSDVNSRYSQRELYLQNRKQNFITASYIQMKINLLFEAKSKNIK